jgi:uncharacterized protein
MEKLRMPDELLERYIAQHIEASPGPVITFSWHGGEPTLAGLDFFRKIAALERRHRPRGRRIFNGMQTNGVLLDDAWCAFLAEEGFGVGLSLDGPEELHDEYRVARGGQPTHRLVLRAFENLKRHGVACEILCAVHGGNAGYPLRLYRYFKDIGAQSISFLPVVEAPRADGAASAAPSVPPDAWGEFLCAIFDEWRQRDIGRVGVQIFEEAARPAQGLAHSMCVFRETCGDIPVVEHNGDFYCCDHYADAAHRLGNIIETPLWDMLQSPGQRAFGAAKKESLPRYCLQCEVLDMCNGGCPKDRFAASPDGEPGLNYLCAGFRKFFSYCRPFFLRVAALERERSRAREGVGRNDPCPCGSGLKYKKCCLPKRP